MKRSALFLALLLIGAPAFAAPKNYSSITTRSGQVFYDCKVVRVYPDGVSFTHRDGAAKISLKDLPASLRREFPYDPQADAQYQREQAAARKAERERARLREIAMEEKLAEAQMAEASYLAAASTAYAAPVAPMATSLPGEPVTVAYQTPSWVGTPISTTSFGGSGYRRSWSGYYPSGYGYGGYPYSGYSNPYYGGYGYPSFGGYNCGYGGGYARPTVFGSWNVGNGIRVGVGVPLGGGLRLFR